MMMYAVVDIGSNTMRLVIYKVEGGRPRALFNKKEMAELASFIKDGMMTAEGINRACYILDSFNLLAKELGVYVLSPIFFRRNDGGVENRAFLLDSRSFLTV